MGRVYHNSKASKKVTAPDLAPDEGLDLAPDEGLDLGLDEDPDLGLDLDDLP